MFMALAQPRYRIVNFRLTAREYEAVFQAGETLGCRSIGEFARTAVLEKAGHLVNPQQTADQLQSLLSKFDEMQKALREIQDKLPAKAGAD